MIHQEVADLRPGSGKEVDDTVGKPRLSDDIHKMGTEHRRVRRGFQDYGIPRGYWTYCHSGQDREREIPRWNDHTSAHGNEE